MCSDLFNSEPEPIYAEDRTTIPFDDRFLIAQADYEYDDYEDFHNDQKIFDTKPNPIKGGVSTRVGEAPLIRYYTENKFHWKRFHADYKDSYTYSDDSDCFFQEVKMPSRYGNEHVKVIDGPMDIFAGIVWMIIFILLYKRFKGKK